MYNPFKKYFMCQNYLKETLRQLDERNVTIRIMKEEIVIVTAEWKRVIDLQISAEKKLEALTVNYADYRADVEKKNGNGFPYCDPGREGID